MVYYIVKVCNENWDSNVNNYYVYDSIDCVNEIVNTCTLTMEVYAFMVGNSTFQITKSKLYQFHCSTDNYQ